MLDNKYNPKFDKTKEAKHDKISAFRKYAEVAQTSYCLELKTNMGSIENDKDFIKVLSDKGYSIFPTIPINATKVKHKKENLKKRVS